MRTLQLKQLLEQTGLPVAYSFYRETPSAPFIVYEMTYSSNYEADDKVYHKRNRYNVELYTDKKDEDLESTIEDLFEANDIVWDKTETFVQSEELFQIVYTIY